MLFEGRYKTQNYFRYFLHLFSVYHLSFRKTEGGLFLFTLKLLLPLKYSLSLFKGWFHLQSFYSVQNASCSFTYIYWHATSSRQVPVLANQRLHS